MQSGGWRRGWLFSTWCSQVGDGGIGYSQPDAVMWVTEGLVILNLMQSCGWRRGWLFSIWCSQVSGGGVGVILNLMQSGGWRQGWLFSTWCSQVGDSGVVILNLRQSGRWWWCWLFLTCCSQVGDIGFGCSQPYAVRWVKVCHSHRLFYIYEKLNYYLQYILSPLEHSVRLPQLIKETQELRTDYMPCTGVKSWCQQGRYITYSTVDPWIKFSPKRLHPLPFNVVFLGRYLVDSAYEYETSNLQDLTPPGPCTDMLYRSWSFWSGSGSPM